MIILFSGFSAWQGRIWAVILKNKRNISLTESINSELFTEYSINELHPQIYLALGLVIGGVVSMFVFKQINATDQK